MSKTITQNRIIFRLFDEKKTANICGNQEATGKVYIPKSITHNNQDYIIKRIENGSFAHSNIKSIEFPPDSKLQTIEANAFMHCTKFNSIIIPQSIIELQPGWCCDTKELKNITIMPGNKNFMYIDDKMIVGKNNSKSDNYDFLLFVRRDIKNVIIPSFIKIICPYSFSESIIERIEIPCHITEIGDNAFSFCQKLQQVTFESNSELHKIGRNAFAFSSIKNIIIPDNIVKIEEESFNKCMKLQKVEFTPKSELKTIERNAFCDSKIETIVFPPKLCELKDRWCHSLEYLTKVIILPNNQHFKKLNDEIIIGKTDSKIDLFDSIILVNRDVKEVIIPQNIKRIASYALAYLAITHIVIPTQVTCICERAFYDCKNLRNIEFSPDSKLKTIGSYAFYGTRIESLTIPALVSDLHNGWISRAENIKTLEIDPNNQNFRKLDDKIIVGKTDLKSDQFDSIVFVNRDVKKLTIPQNIKVIASSSFAYTPIQSISIPRSVKVICESAFFKCNLLKRIDIPEDSQLTAIDHFVLALSSITSIFIPSKVISISSTALDFTFKLKIIEFDENSDFIIKETWNINCKIIMLPVTFRSKFF